MFAGLEVSVASFLLSLLRMHNQNVKTEAIMATMATPTAIPTIAPVESPLEPPDGALVPDVFAGDILLLADEDALVDEVDDLLLDLDEEVCVFAGTLDVVCVVEALDSGRTGFLGSS